MQNWCIEFLWFTISPAKLLGPCFSMDATYLFLVLFGLCVPVLPYETVSVFWSGRVYKETANRISNRVEIKNWNLLDCFLGSWNMTPVPKLCSHCSISESSPLKPAEYTLPRIIKMATGAMRPTMSGLSPKGWFSNGKKQHASLRRKDPAHHFWQDEARLSVCPRWHLTQGWQVILSSPTNASKNRCWDKKIPPRIWARTIAAPNLTEFATSICSCPPHQKHITISQVDESFNGKTRKTGDVWSGRFGDLIPGCHVGRFEFAAASGRTALWSIQGLLRVLWSCVLYCTDFRWSKHGV